MIENKIIIPGKMPGFNDIIKAAKSHYHQYNNMKRENTNLVAWTRFQFLIGRLGTIGK